MTLIRKHGLAIATAISVGLLVLAANLQPQPARFWLLISGWPILAICIWGWFGRLPEKSPFRNGLIFSVFLAVIFSSGLIDWGGRPLFNLIVDPSGKHLFLFLTNRAFLLLAVIYFATVCAGFRGQLQEAQEDLRYCREMLKESLDDNREREKNTSGPATH